MNFGNDGRLRTSEKVCINREPLVETTYTSILVLSFLEGSVCQQL